MNTKSRKRGTEFGLSREKYKVVPKGATLYFCYTVNYYMIFKNSMLLAFFSVLSVLLGIVRDRLLVQYVGVGSLLDTYNAAFRIPDLALGIFLSFAAAGTVIPFLTKDHTNDNQDGLRARFSSLFFFFGSAMSFVSIFVVVTLPLYAHRIVPGFTQDQLTMFISVTRLLMIQPILLGVSTLISSLAQLRHQFLLYGIAPLIYTLAIIASIFLYPQYGLKVIIFGVLIGSVLHLLLQAFTLVTLRIRPKLSLFRWHLIKEHMHIALPRSGSLINNRIRDLVFASIATTLGVGALSVFVFSQRLIDAFMQIIVQSISSASLPRLASDYETGNMQSFHGLIKKGISSVLSFSLLMFLTITFFGRQIVTLLYGKGSHVEDITHLLSLLGIGLPILAVNYYFAAAFNATKDTKTLYKANTIATIVSIVSLLWYRAHDYGIVSLGYASIVMSVTYLLLLVLFYSRKRVQISS